MDNLSYPKSINYWLRSCRYPHFIGIFSTAIIILILFQLNNAVTHSIKLREKRDANQQQQIPAFHSIVTEIANKNDNSVKQTSIVSDYTNGKYRRNQNQQRQSKFVKTNVLNDGNSHRQQHERFRQLFQQQQEQKPLRESEQSSNEDFIKNHRTKAKLSSTGVNHSTEKQKSNSTNSLLSSNFSRHHNKNRNLNILSSRNSKPKINHNLRSNLATYLLNEINDNVVKIKKNDNLNVGGTSNSIIKHEKILSHTRSNSKNETKYGNYSRTSISNSSGVSFQRPLKEHLLIRGNEGYLLVQKYKCFMCKVIPGEPTRRIDGQAVSLNKQRQHNRGRFFVCYQFVRSGNLF